MRVSAIREAALRVLRKRGNWSGVGNNKMLCAEVEECSICYRTPFQKLPEPPEAMRYWAAQVGRKIDFQYGLDIWFRHKKVLNVMWDDGADFEIVSFKPGEWEGAITA